MALDHLIVLAIVQGISEFLPVSSSAHLILIPSLTDWPDQGRRIDVATHIGSLLAVLIYYRHDVAALLRGGLDCVVGRAGPDRRLLFNVIIASLPLVVAGFCLYLYFPDDFFRDYRLIAWASIIFGILLYIADRGFLVVKRVEHMNTGDALMIGLVQIFAFIPGSSRAGLTMTAARALGYERHEAARFSMLLSIPAILGAGGVIAYELYQLSDWAVTDDVIFVAALSFFSAFLAITVLLAWLRRAGFTPFVIYRIGLGVAILWFFGDYSV